MEIQKFIDTHSKLFGKIPKVIPPARDHDHDIYLQPGSVPPNVRHYKYPYAQRVRLKMWFKKC